MRKANLKKALSSFVAAAMLSSMFTGFAVTASAEESLAGTQTFTEDFSSYTAENVATTVTEMKMATAGQVAATHPSGAQWKIPATAAGRGNETDADRASKFLFDTDNDRIKMSGYGEWYWGTLNLDLGNALKVDKIKRFTFTTRSQANSAGARLFVSGDESSYIEFSIAGNRWTGTFGDVPTYMPKVVSVSGGTRTVLFNAGTAVDNTTQGAKDGWTKTDEWDWKELKWVVDVNDDNSISWTVTSIGGAYANGEASSSGTISADIAEPLIQFYKYPAALMADGDADNWLTSDFGGSYITGLSFDYIPGGTETFTEDFSSYTEENVPTTSTKMTADKSGQVAATHPSGAQWLIPTTQFGRGDNGGRYLFETANKRIKMSGLAGWGEGTLNLSLGDSVKYKEIKKFNFSTNSRGEAAGVRLFVDKSEKNYIEFALAGNRWASTTRDSTPAYMPKVTVSNSGTRTVLFNAGTAVDDTTQGAKDGWKDSSNNKAVKWTVSINDDGSISWSVISTGGIYANGEARSSGTIPAETVEPIMSSHKYPAALMADGDDYDSYITSFDFSYVPDEGENFTENFSGYTSETTKMTADTAEIPAAVHPSGAVWRIPATEAARASNNAKYTFDTAGYGVKMSGWGDWKEGNLNLDLNGAIAVEKYKKFKFSTYSQNEAAGVRLFVNSAENSYIEFAVAGWRYNSTTRDGVPAYIPKVVAVNGGTRTTLYNGGTAVDDTTQAAKDGWTKTGDYVNKAVDWTVTVNDDGSLSWTAVASGGEYAAGSAKSEGTITADVAEPIMSSHKYPAAVMADGDDYTSYITSFSFSYIPDSTYIAPNFHEDFTEYIADGNTQTEVYKLNQGVKTLATHSSGAKWVSSGKYFGLAEGNGRAYVDVTGNRLAAVGWGQWNIAKINLDYSDKKYDINKIKFTSQMGNGRVIGLSMFVGGADEDNFIFFGQLTSEAVVFGINNFKEYAPVIVKRIDGVTTVLQMTPNTDTTSTWSSGDKNIDWTIDFDENHNVTWTAKGSSRGTASGTIENDADIAELMTRNWSYPLAATVVGDDYAFIKSVDMWSSEPQEVTYEKKAYTRSEFEALYENARYGKAADTEKLMKLDLGEINEGTAKADVTVGTSAKTVSSSIFGSHTEYCDYSNQKIVDADGNLTDSYKKAAKKMAPIASYRLGGGSAMQKNMLKDLKDEDSYYLSAEYLPADLADKAGTVSEAHNAYDLAVQINMALANNPNATFNLCISPLTTTPEEVSELISILTGSDSSYRRAYGLSEEPVKIEYIELGNELDGITAEIGGARKDWYGSRIPLYINAIEAADSSIKLIANGVTCPWSGESSYNFWLDMLTATRTVNGADYRIIDHVDGISFHPYYAFGNMSADGLLGTLDKMKAYLDKTAPGNNVKYCITEHATGWHGTNTTGADGNTVTTHTALDTAETTSLKAALLGSSFISQALKRDYIDTTMYYHGTNGHIWGRMNNNNGDMLISTVGDAYSFLTDEWKNTVLDTTVSVEDGVLNNYEEDFAAVAVRGTANELKLILTNAAAYKDVDTTFNLPAKYTLVNEKVFTAPNVYSSVYNKNCVNIASAVSKDCNVEDFSTYKVPSKSIVVLTLKTEDGKSELSENFDYSNVDVTADAVRDVAVNANGAKWVTSEVNNGFVDADYETTFDPTYGTVSVSGKSLVIANAAASGKKTSANWDISGLELQPADISDISFTITGANGGVKLFADVSENSAFNFSNAAAGLSGTVNWAIAIADGTLTWTASDGATEKTGTMSITDADMTGYAYLASAYLNENVAGSVSFDNFSVRYGGSTDPEIKGIEYTNGTNTIDITVNPSAYGKASARIYVGYYSADGTLTGVNTALVSADGTVVNSAKPSSYSSAKIFVWDTASQTPLADEIPVQ